MSLKLNEICLILLSSVALESSDTISKILRAPQVIICYEQLRLGLCLDTSELFYLESSRSSSRYSTGDMSHAFYAQELLVRNRQPNFWSRKLLSQLNLTDVMKIVPEIVSTSFETFQICSWNHFLDRIPMSGFLCV